MIGTPIEELDTPALLIDMAALKHNIGVIAGHYGKDGNEDGIRLRPHGKNHKCPRILAMQIEAGGTVDGVCAARSPRQRRSFRRGGAKRAGGESGGGAGQDPAPGGVGAAG